MLIHRGKKEWSYSFKTGPLKENDTNVFTLIVGRRNPKLGAYLKSLAKIQKRLHHIESQIEKLRPSQPHYQQKIAFLNLFKDIFVKTIMGIEKVIDASPDVLARFSKPLLVNNKQNGHLAYSSIFNDNKLTLTSLPGVVSENQVAVIGASVLKLNGKNKWKPTVEWGMEDSSGRNNKSNTLKLMFNDKIINQKEFQKLLPGEEIVLSSSVNGLPSIKSNILELQFLDNQTGNFNVIKLPLTITKGEVAPVISLISPPAGVGPTNLLPMVEAEILSPTGKVDRDSVEITANGSPLSLEISSSDGDKTLHVSSMLTGLEDGDIEIIVRGADVSGNKAQAVSRTFTYDSTKPLISSTLVENTVLGIKELSFTVNIQDASGTSTKVLHNGVIVSETNLKEFQVEVELANGANTFEIQAVDEATNIATPLKFSNIVFNENASPVANLALSPNFGYAPLVVSLDASGSSDDKGIVRYVFEPEAGIVIDSTVPSIAYTFSTSGSHNAKVTVYDIEGVSSSATATVTVEQKIPPTAVIQLSKNEIFSGESIEVIGTGSSKGSSDIVSYSVEFGDGVIDTNNSGTFFHVYNASGEFIVKLTVTDGLGESSSAIAKILVKAHIGPTAKLSLTKTEVFEGEPVAFDASESIKGSSEIIEYRFIPGDGTTHSQAGPVFNYTYSTSGSYTPAVQVVDQNGQSSTISQSLLVKPSTGPIARFTYRLDTEDGTLTTFFQGREGSSKIVKATYSTSSGLSVDLPEILWRSSYTFPISAPFEMDVTLTVVDEFGKTDSSTLHVSDDLSPFLNIYAYNIGERKVLFDFRDSFDPSDILEDVTIDYGDGASDSYDYVLGLSVHTYQSSGTYNVKIFTWTQEGVPVEKTISVEVIDLIMPTMPPIASFLADVGDPFANVTFYLDHSVALSGEIASVFWDHGDGTIYSGSEKIHTHFYDPGSYLVKLTVTDSNGLQNTQTQRIIVHDSGPSLVAEIYCDNGEGGRSVGCEAQALDRFADLSEIIIDWGDGTFAYYPATNKEWMLLELDHTYLEDNTYNLKVTAKTFRGEEVVAEQPIQIDGSGSNGENQPPFIAFNCFADQKNVFCDGSMSYDPDGFIISYEWNMGDGQLYPNSSPFISHSYLSEGQFVVTLTTTDNLGQMSSTSQIVPIVSINQLPIAALDCQIDPINPLKVICDGSGSQDYDGTITNFFWDFGDGGVAEGERVSHIYPTAGEFQIQLKVIDNSQGEGNQSFQLKLNAGPQAKLSCTESGNLTLTCSANLSNDSDGQISRYLWKLSDGATYSGIDFTHTFTSFGTKNVILSITDDSGARSYDEYEHLFKDPDLKPVSVFFVDIDHDNKTAKFDASLSLKDGRVINKFIWQIDGGTPTETTGPVYTHSFASFGQYSVTLTVVDQNSLQASSSHNFKIFNMPVPDPGDAGKTTIEGIDSDQDGVRDDVQRLIVVLGNENLQVKSALTSVAKNWQLGILAKDDPVLSKELTHKRLKFLRCLMSRQTNDEEASLTYRIMASEIFNTRERLMAYVQTSSNFSGEIVEESLPIDQYQTLCE